MNLDLHQDWKYLKALWNKPHATFKFKILMTLSILCNLVTKISVIVQQYIMEAVMKESLGREATE